MPESKVRGAQGQTDAHQYPAPDLNLSKSLCLPERSEGLEPNPGTQTYCPVYPVKEITVGQFKFWQGNLKKL